MILGKTLSQAQITLGSLALSLVLAVMLALVPQSVAAQDAVEAEAVETVAAGDAVVDGASGYTPMAPTPGKGMPVDKRLGFQDQYTDDGEYALFMHDAILMPVITIISLFVLALLLWVVVRYRRREGVESSRTTHNTAIEVIWTIVPVLILVGIAVPSITLLARQYETPPEDAVTIKATGYQWYWTYTYPDNGDFEIVSNMMPEADALANGEPPQLAVDNRMVVPANTPLRIQTTAADVIHAFAVPSLWFKIDAVPGRLNERLVTINEPGVYYGQCSELCGARHGYMPITVEALPREQYDAWVLAQGGTIGDEETLAEEDAQSAQDAADAGDADGAEEAEDAEAEAADEADADTDTSAA